MVSLSVSEPQQQDMLHGFLRVLYASFCIISSNPIKLLKKQIVFTVIPDAPRRSPSARPCLSFFGQPPCVIPTSASYSIDSRTHYKISTFLSDVIVSVRPICPDEIIGIAVHAQRNPRRAINILCGKLPNFNSFTGRMDVSISVYIPSSDAEEAFFIFYKNVSLLLFALHASELISAFVAYHYPVVKSSKENRV